MIHKITSLKNSFLITLLFSSLLSSNEVIVIDVRSLEEVKTGIIESAIHIEWTEISEEINGLNLQKEQSIFLYCRSGNSCLLYTSPSPRDATLSRMPSSA